MTDQQDQRPDDAADGRAGSTGLVVGLVVVAVAALVGVVVLAGGDGEDDQVVAEDPGGSGTTSTVAATTSTTDADTGQEGPGDDFVGMSELQVRERTPLVRVVERDGEPLPATMDLQPGRVNLTVRDGEVVAATVEGCDDLAGSEPDWVAAACSPGEESGPDSFGKLVPVDGGDSLALEVGFEADPYYDGMVVVPATGTPMVRGMDGASLEPTDLRAGDVVLVWVAEGCAVSDPVQCELSAIVVDR